MRNRKLQRIVLVGAACLLMMLALHVSLVNASEAFPPTIQEVSAKSGAYTQSGGVVSKTHQIYTATQQDESGVYVLNSGIFTLTNSTIWTSGNTSSQDNSSFYGLNAAVLAESASKIYFTHCAISTTGTGANGAFATGSGSAVSLSDVTIYATGDGGHGVMATQGGALTLVDVDMSTAGRNSGAIATDRGGGTIVATGGVVETSGQDSPGIYSTGAIAVTGGVITATGAEAAVIEGSNSIVLTNTLLSSSKADKWGVMIYQSMSGDAEGANGVFTMNGGKLVNTSVISPLFYVTNATGRIILKGVNVVAASGTLLQATAGRWGTSGQNGGTAILTATGQALTGNLVADSISTITVTLQSGSSLTGSINSAQTASWVGVTLDSSSRWNVTADSYVKCLRSAAISGTSTPVSNLIGNGHTIYYETSYCPALGGETYPLTNGGYLKSTTATTYDFSLFLPLVLQE